MLFNSFVFLFLFLPITVAGFFWAANRNHLLAAGWLALASIIFYGWWSYRYIPLLLGSVLFNYMAGWQIGHTAGVRKKHWLIFAITVNLGLLSYYKYANFFISNINHLFQADLGALDIILPIGISFFTFTQIAFLVDTYQDKVREYRFIHYLLFVTYFPHLIAGPVLHHKEMMPQFEDSASYRLSSRNFAIGFSIFTIGLAKKVLIADSLAPQAAAVFDSGETPSLLIAWGGVLAYAFQLYFDFSGYSDMAIGLSRLFGVRLPLNFNSPYKAKNISDFWRRWHMTLSRFLRDYLYIPLGGNRRGAIRRYANLLTTMLLGGLWHGAGWNFVIWGGLHGVYLTVHQFWSTRAKRPRFRRAPAWTWAAGALTFIAVCFAWVFFRAADLSTALTIAQGMLGHYGIGLPDVIGSRLGSFKPLLEQWGVTFYLGGGSRFMQTWAWIIPAAIAAFLLPNTQQIFARFDPALDFDNRAVAITGLTRQLQWRPTSIWALWIGALATVCLLLLNRPAEFLYFQF